MVQSKQIQYCLSRVRKSLNANYRMAIKRNKSNRPKNPPLIDLLEYLKSKKVSDLELDKVVDDYWKAVEKDPNFEKQFADQIKNKYNKNV
jgi:hypothetical protein